MIHICSFPAEILSEIFTCVIFNPPDPFNPVPMTQSLVAIYSSLQNLLGVCSLWRSVVLSRGSLWSIIPIVESYRFGVAVEGVDKWRSTDLSLARSGRTDLHLAAIVSEQQMTENLTKDAFRFRSINILGRSRSAIESVMRYILRSDSPLQVDCLSIRNESYSRSSILPLPRHRLFPPDTPKHKEFESLVASLSTLRISGAPLHWDRINFTHRLVELDLQNIMLGYDWTLRNLVDSLSSATELRSLKFISIRTFPSSLDVQNTQTTSVSFPKLQTVFARDLYFNTLDTLLSSIGSRSHRLELYLTNITLCSPQVARSAPRKIPVQDVLDLFRRVTVDSLSLVRLEGRDSWASAANIRAILHSMPDLKTLRMHNWDYYTACCEAIHQPETPGFPQLKWIYLTKAKIRDEEAFRNMVASYSRSLEHMELAGAVIQGSGRAHLNDYLPVEGDEKIVAWLKDNVPSFELRSTCATPPETRDPVWQLW